MVILGAGRVWRFKMVTINQAQWTSVDPNSYFMPGIVYRAYYSVKRIPLLPTRVQEIIIQTQMRFRKKFPGIKVLKWQFEGDFFVVEFIKEAGVTPVTLGLITLAVIVVAISGAFISCMIWLNFREIRQAPREIVEKAIEAIEKASQNAMIAMVALAGGTPISLYFLRGILFKK